MHLPSHSFSLDATPDERRQVVQMLKAAGIPVDSLTGPECDPDYPYLYWSAYFEEICNRRTPLTSLRPNEFLAQFGLPGLSDHLSDQTITITLREYNELLALRKTKTYENT